MIVEIKQKVRVGYLKFVSEVRYCEDSMLNGEADEKGQMPCLKDGK